MVTHLIVKPAYGRKYESDLEVFRDWVADKDFQIVGAGAYINRKDFHAHIELQSISIVWGSDLPLRIEKTTGIS